MAQWYGWKNCFFVKGEMPLGHSASIFVYLLRYSRTKGDDLTCNGLLWLLASTPIDACDVYVTYKSHSEFPVTRQNSTLMHRNGGWRILFRRCESRCSNKWFFVLSCLRVEGASVGQGFLCRDFFYSWAVCRSSM